MSDISKTEAENANGDIEKTNGQIHDETTKVTKKTKKKEKKEKKDKKKKDTKTDGTANGTANGTPNGITNGKKKEDEAKEIKDNVETDLDDSDIVMEDADFDGTNGTTIGAPEGWFDDESDIDDDDIDAQIKRCQERIVEGKMREYYEDKLKMLGKEKLHRAEAMERWPLVSSFDVAKRLDFFKGLLEHLHEKGDKHKVQSTIEAIMKQYLTKNLDWIPGNVTYWSYGKQLTQPRPFDWNEFLALNFKYEGWAGFWVEGMRDSTPVRRFWKRTICWPGPYIMPAVQRQHSISTGVKVPIALRIIRRPVYSGEAEYRYIDPNWNQDPNRPSVHFRRGVGSNARRVPVNPVDANVPLAGVQPPFQPNILTLPGPSQTTYPDPQDPHEHQIIWMNDDTGSDTCVLNQSDIDSLVRKAREQHPDAELPPLLGYIQTWVGGTTFYEVARTLQINLRADDGKLMLKEWENIEVAIAEDDTDPRIYEPIRLIGPWLRHRFYTATSPDGTNRLYIVKKMRRLFHMNHVYVGFSGLLPGLTINQGVGREQIAETRGLMRQRRQTGPPGSA